MKSLLKLIKSELYKLIKSNTLYVMTGLLTAVILLMTWIYAEQEKNVTYALEWLLGNALSTDSFDIIDGELDELKDAGIDTTELDNFAKQLEDKPEIKLMLLGVEPSLFRAFASQSDGAGEVFKDYISFSSVQEMLYYDYFRSLYYDYQFKYYLNKDILNYIKQSNYNVSFSDYIINKSMKDLFASYEDLFGKTNQYFETDGAYYKFMKVKDSGNEKLVDSRYNDLIQAADKFFEELDKFEYLTESSLRGANYLLMPTKNYISEEYAILKTALNSVTRRARWALNAIKQQKLTEQNQNVFYTELFNLMTQYIPKAPMPVPEIDLTYTVPAKSEEPALKQAYQVYTNFLDGLRDIAQNDNQDSSNLFYAYNEDMIRKAYQFLTTQDFDPIDPGKINPEQKELQAYIQKIEANIKNDKLILDAALPFEAVINSGYSTVITKDIYNEYFKPYYDDKEKARLEELMDSINEKLNRYSSAEILFYNIPAESIVAGLSQKFLLPEPLQEQIKTLHEQNQKEKFAEFAAFYNEIKSEFKKFAPRSKTLDSLIKNTNFIITIETRGLNDNQARKIQGFIFTSRYMLNSYITQAQFLIENDAESTNYTAPESLSKGYGAMEFIFILTEIIIMIFGIVLASGTIAGEHSDGTMKLLLIRPHTRGNVLLAKFLTICLVVFGFFAFNFVVTFLIGGVGWGLKGANMALSIFNSKTALILHPAAVVFFLHLFGFFQSIVFALISLTISTLFRSRSGATAVSILVYFVAFILDAFLSGFDWYKYVIFNNTNLFQYMNSTGPAIADLTLWFSLTVTLIYVAIMAIICFFTFAKRDAN